jgi:hemin uptake protein HemP
VYLTAVPDARGISEDGLGAERLEPASSAVPGEAGARRRIPSTALFCDRREIVIVHRGQEYRLRITRADKLILTK